ncbi:CxxC motif-containing protein [Paramaledivibacter caminithermalis DSM 15212]|uniref:CxxC motif-containing protein n=2 Tax=Paramaledivibacter TaxID=1884934 RepID=A0A1M6Q8H8_PARC5|nr:CxxC motif-containing protein [Paramaledivibacter caminithermalis DSM 15212]
MEMKKMVCIVCPLGCHIKISKDNDDYIVEGNKCPRGKEYAIKELTNPTRVLTTTVKIKNGLLNRLPVKTKEAIPKDKIYECMKIINSIEVEAPVTIGEVIVKDILNTGVDVVASRSM